MESVHTTFGAVFLYWIALLDQRAKFLINHNDAQVLFCTRAGKRIHDLLVIYDNSWIEKGELFGISRIAACKAALGNPASFSAAFEVLEESLANDGLNAVCRAFLVNDKNCPPAFLSTLENLKQPFNREAFRLLLAANDPASHYFKQSMLKSHNALGDWLKRKSHSKGNFVLVDSGWKGSIQKTLTATYPDLNFHGLYFGVMDGAHFDNRSGIIFDAPFYHPEKPETVFTLHRHLVEDMLEVNAPSVEEVVGGPNSQVYEEQLSAVIGELPNEEVDAFYLAIREYIKSNRNLPFDEIFYRYSQSLPLVVQYLTQPTLNEARILGGNPRSVDFGREGSVATLIDPQSSNDVTASARIQAALWTQGQLALEYPAEKAKRYQLNSLKNSAGSDYFTSHLELVSTVDGLGTADDFGFAGSVAIITRTKNRPILFKRAAASVARQTWRNFHWVIVNDGGDFDEVREIIECSGVARQRITLIENETSVGMEAASNLGVQASKTEFVVIHDDDDAWESDFLSESIKFLMSKKALARNEAGVVSRAWRMSEEIKDNKPYLHRKERFMPWVDGVSIGQMAIGNFFAPISFVFRRSMYDEIGGYNENLPVLGDWRFNLDFLSRANIGFLDKYLAFYYHRDVFNPRNGVTYSNSVVGAQSLHAEYATLVLNDFLRNPDISAGVAAAVGASHFHRINEMRFNGIDKSISELTVLHGHLNKVTHVDGDYRQASIGQNGLKKEKKYIRIQLKNALATNVTIDQKIRILLGLFTLPYFGKFKARSWLLRLAGKYISSPPDFDYLEYLRLHPEIWATKYNGPNELLPYHHYIKFEIER